MEDGEGLITVCRTSPSAWAKRCVTQRWTRLHKPAWRNTKTKPSACLNAFGQRQRFGIRMLNGLDFLKGGDYVANGS